MSFIYNKNIEIVQLNNIEKVKTFMKTLGHKNADIFYNYKYMPHCKYFHDYDKNNYILCYIYIDNEDKPFDEILYNDYHKKYLKYFENNHNIKIIIWTNNVNWCKNIHVYVLNNFKIFFSDIKCHPP